MSATCGSCGQTKRRKRAPRVREAAEFAADMRRWMRAYAARVADADDVDLADMLALRGELDQAIAAAVTGQRERHGRSWADIAQAAGVTRQAAQQRWGRTASPTTAVPCACGQIVHDSACPAVAAARA